MLCLITVVGKEDEKVRVGFTVIIAGYGCELAVKLAVLGELHNVRPNFGAVHSIFCSTRFDESTFREFEVDYCHTLQTYFELLPDPEKLTNLTALYPISECSSHVST